VENCPTSAIPYTPEENFVIDAGKCIPLYNEIKGEFPSWINPDAHNALMGCMRCQLKCPANSETVKLTEKFEAVSEEETNMILEGKSDKILLESLTKKLRRACSMEFLPILKRNLKVLLH
jgi:epoxyqueuosine reductase